MRRPTFEEIVAAVNNTVDKQFANARDGSGRLLREAFPRECAAMQDRIANNIAATVCGWLDAALGEETK